MIFTRLKLNYFGRFVNKEIELKPGLNLIYGENEAGKSTIHTFIRGMLFGIERLRGRGAASKEDTYTRYLPWEYPGAYSGSMDICLGDKHYRLQRSFHANDKSFQVIELATGREVILKEGLIRELIPGLTESIYKNTISMEQLKAATDSELAAQVRNYITNLSIAKSKEVNVAQAVSVLQDKRKHLETMLNADDLKTLQVVIAEGEEREKRMEELMIKLRELLIEGQHLSEYKQTAGPGVDTENSRWMEQLPVILEKYRSFCSLTNQEQRLEQELVVKKNQIVTGAERQAEVANLNKAAETFQQLQKQQKELDQLNLELNQRKVRLNRRSGRAVVLTILPTAIMAFLTGSIMGWKGAGILVSTAIMIIGVAVLATFILTYAKKNRTLRTLLEDNKQAYSVLEVQYQTILESYHIGSAEELSLMRESVIRDAYAYEQAGIQEKELEKRRSELEDERDMLYDEIMRYQQHFISDEELTDATMERLRETVEERKQEVLKQQSSLSRQQEENRLSVEKLRWEISSLENNEAELMKNRDSYQELERKQKEARVELEAVKLALSVIDELSVDIHDSFGQKLNTALSGLIREITADKYSDLKVDERLEIKVGLNGDYVLMDRLSAGTVDQIYFALRIVAAKLLLGGDELPLLLDDSFALYDETRLKAILQELSGRKQVILFTCHKREGQLLDEMGIPYHSVKLS